MSHAQSNTSGLGGIAEGGTSDDMRAHTGPIACSCRSRIVLTATSRESTALQITPLARTICPNSQVCCSTTSGHASPT